MVLHAKYKGTLGELKVATEFVKMGFPVFTEMGDNSKVDLIVLTPEPIKIQIKASNSVNGIVKLDSRKSGPGYKYRYLQEDVDIFAVYVLDHDIVFYISSKELLQQKTVTSFRLPYKSDINGARKVNNYIDFRRALRDYTGNTLASIVGDEIVQTTTNESRSGKPDVVGKPNVVGSSPTVPITDTVKRNYCVCGEEIGKQSKTCSFCRPKRIRKTKIEWPSPEVLFRMLAESSFRSVGRELGVSDNAVRKRIENYPV